MYDLNGKVALVTGAGRQRGIGRAIATRLAHDGADIVVNDVAENPDADHPSGWSGLPDLVREIEGMGRRALSVVADISDSGHVDNMVRDAMDYFGQIDILVNNAAARQGSDVVPVVELEEEVWDLTQRVNVKGTFLCSRAAAREMIRRGEGGKIIIISSKAGKLGSSGPLMRLPSSPKSALPSGWPWSWPHTESMSMPFARARWTPSGLRI